MVLAVRFLWSDWSVLFKWLRRHRLHRNWSPVRMPLMQYSTQKFVLLKKTHFGFNVNSKFCGISTFNPYAITDNWFFLFFFCFSSISWPPRYKHLCLEQVKRCFCKCYSFALRGTVEFSRNISWLYHILQRDRRSKLSESKGDFSWDVFFDTRVETLDSVRHLRQTGNLERSWQKKQWISGVDKTGR